MLNSVLKLSFKEGKATLMLVNMKVAMKEPIAIAIRHIHLSGSRVMDD